MSNIVKYDWQSFDKDVQILANLLLKIKENNILITGLPRGGLTLAVILSHMLKVPYVNISNCTMQESANENRTLIICEDILDSGKTFENSVKYLQFWDWKSIIYVFLHSKEKWNLQKNKFTLLNKCKVCTANIVDNNDYILYPWEKEVENKPKLPLGQKQNP